MAKIGLPKFPVGVNQPTRQALKTKVTIPAAGNSFACGRCGQRYDYTT